MQRSICRRHCERSEAIQLSRICGNILYRTSGALAGLLRRSIPRNGGFLYILCLFLLFPLPAKTEEIRGMKSVTILAASSLTNVISELAGIYTRKNNIAVSVALDSSSYLATQIIEGEPADIFISAHPQFMTELKQRGLVDVYTITPIAGNSLVLAASKHIALDRRYLKGKDVTTIMQQVSNRAIPVIADPAEVPLGIYTEQALRKLGLWKLFNHKVIRTESARAALYLIAKGETLGITYYTDAVNNPEVDILAHFMGELHEPIAYQAAVVAGENMPMARDFLKFLSSKEAKKVLKRHGFVVK